MPCQALLPQPFPAAVFRTFPKTVYLAHTPTIVQRLFDQFVWRDAADHQVVYLTFDDGPIPEVTPWVLDLLAEYDAKATFFCVGENVERNPEIFARLRREGHAVGNHTHNHLSGWSNDIERYLDNIERCNELVDSTLFRPPYGRLHPRASGQLRERYRIVMWDVLSGDFDSSISGDECVSNVLDHVAPGSIVVFHDSLKSERNLRYALPRTLAALTDQGYCFNELSQAGASEAVRSAAKTLSAPQPATLVA